MIKYLQRREWNGSQNLGRDQLGRNGLDGMAEEGLDIGLQRDEEGL
jgi:hypothetical protein